MARSKSITIDGPDPITLTGTPDDRDQYGWVTDRFVINCHTGRVIDGRWSGIPIAGLVDADVFPAATTHLLVEGTDGHRVCVPIRRAVEALLSFECVHVDRGRTDNVRPSTENEASTVDGASPIADTPRFLAPDIDSSRAVRNVTRIESIALDPAADPGELAYHVRKDSSASEGRTMLHRV